MAIRQILPASAPGRFPPLTEMPKDFIYLLPGQTSIAHQYSMATPGKAIQCFKIRGDAGLQGIEMNIADKG